MLPFEKVCFGTAAISFVTLFSALVMLARIGSGEYDGSVVLNFRGVGSINRGPLNKVPRDCT